MLRTDDQQVLADRISFHEHELVIDTVHDVVSFRGEAVSLTQTEYKLLLVLARHPQRHFTREEL
ncbi:hypothetical protein O9H85_28685 [Paenibacillus filicis]|uniref:OmpR/PhoB-type domain-containing protein n=1 Tax=Paenibacillus gyeongsangnamensis TaxID=3388067 RepID=A0ABT4QHK8_9BACL|nr:winged helix-turn-helix domain-containing protein [Paenibacillus filicis]MCZ8516298.1 hypothetical protein [Paenibacillus filicis]